MAKVDLDELLTRSGAVLRGHFVLTSGRQGGDRAERLAGPLIERFPIGDVSAGYGFGSAKTLNVMAESMRLAFADRHALLPESYLWGLADTVRTGVEGLLDVLAEHLALLFRSTFVRA